MAARRVAAAAATAVAAAARAVLAQEAPDADDSNIATPPFTFTDEAPTNENDVAAAESDASESPIDNETAVDAAFVSNAPSAEDVNVGIPAVLGQLADIPAWPEDDEDSGDEPDDGSMDEPDTTELLLEVMARLERANQHAQFLHQQVRHQNLQLDALWAHVQNNKQRSPTPYVMPALVAAAAGVALVAAPTRVTLAHATVAGLVAARVVHGATKHA